MSRNVQPQHHRVGHARSALDQRLCEDVLSLLHGLDVEEPSEPLSVERELGRERPALAPKDQAIPW